MQIYQSFSLKCIALWFSLLRLEQHKAQVYSSVTSNTVVVSQQEQCIRLKRRN